MNAPKLEEAYPDGKPCCKMCKKHYWSKDSVRARDQWLAKLLEECECGCEINNHDESGQCNSCSFDDFDCRELITNRYNKVISTLKGVLEK